MLSSEMNANVIAIGRWWTISGSGSCTCQSTECINHNRSEYRHVKSNFSTLSKMCPIWPISWLIIHQERNSPQKSCYRRTIGLRLRKTSEF